MKTLKELGLDDYCFWNSIILECSKCKKTFEGLDYEEFEKHIYDCQVLKK